MRARDHSLGNMAHRLAGIMLARRVSESDEVPALLVAPIAEQDQCV